MRLSIEKDDPGYAAYAKLFADEQHPKIYLDGVEQRCCLTADSDDGVKRLVTSKKGNPAHTGGELLTEIVSGQVDIIIPEPAS